jgi:hypothetical protein
VKRRADCVGKPSLWIDIVQLGGLIKVNTLACQTGGMSPPGSSAAFDSFNEITTVRIELRDTDPVMWRQVEVPTSITLKVLHRIIRLVVRAPARMTPAFTGMTPLPPMATANRSSRA